MVPEVISITGRLALLIPSHEGGWIEPIQYSNDPRAHQPHYMADDIQSDMSERRVRSMGNQFRIPMEVHLLVPRKEYRVLNPPLGYCIVYHEQVRAGVRFPLLSLLIEVLSHYNLALTQLVPNAVRVIVGFERVCRARG